MEIGFAGGGGSSSDSGWGSSSSDSRDSWGSSSSYSRHHTSSGSSSAGPGGFFLASSFVFVLIVVLTIIVRRISEHHTNNHSELPVVNPLSELAKVDNNSTDKENLIHDEAAKIFLSYQTDWSENNLKHIKEYTTKKYFKHVSLMLRSLEKAGRQNVVSNLHLIKTSLPFSVNENDKFPLDVKVIFKFSGFDEIVDNQTGNRLHGDQYYGILEMWNFVFDGESLKPDGITQPTESSSHLVKDLATFANDNGLFYSADWGRAILPNRGLVFSNSSLITSDVNNFVVGEWGDCLVQIYSYAKNPSIPDAYYLVGQLNVPKKYRGMIVESKQMGFMMPSGYEKYTTEWNDFNRQYNIYATKDDSLPLFELLNPKFMASLYDRNLNYSMEVIDNVIYIFAKITETSKEDYQELLDILTLAYKELKN